MSAQRPDITAPIIIDEGAMWFSAYGFDWGYCAFSIPFDAVCEYLGAANKSRRQLILAFELGRHRIREAVERSVIPETGQRIVLSLAPSEALGSEMAP